MSVFISVEDKEGEALAPVIDVDRIPRRFKAAEGTLCLRFITDEEDASFNRFQLPILVAELDAIDATKLAPEEQEELVKVARLCRRFQDKPGVRVCFYAERGGE